VCGDEAADFVAQDFRRVMYQISFMGDATHHGAVQEFVGVAQGRIGRVGGVPIREGRFELRVFLEVDVAFADVQDIESIGAGGIPIQEIQITVNVDLTDDGFEPSTIYIPAGRGVQLFLRNRGTTEHHYRIAGLVPAQLSWLASTAYMLSNMQVRPEDISEEDHLLHHLVGWAPFRDASLFGIRPIGNEVHGYAASGDRDIVRFIATNTGTFRVEDVLHPEISGEVVVFSP